MKRWGKKEQKRELPNSLYKKGGDGNYAKQSEIWNKKKNFVVMGRA